MFPGWRRIAAITSLNLTRQPTDILLRYSGYRLIFRFVSADDVTFITIVIACFLLLGAGLADIDR